MVRRPWIIALFVLGGSSGWAQPQDPHDPYYQIVSIKNEFISKQVEPLRGQEFMQLEAAFQQKSFQLEAAAPMINPYLIAQLLMYAWDLVVKNKPVANLEAKHVSALPVLAEYHWSRLTGWRPERVLKQKLTITNFWGMKPIEMTYGIKLLYGGSVRGRGQYIASARVVPSDVKVLPGYQFNVGVEVLSATHVGPDYDPTAQIIFELLFRVQTALKKDEWKERYLLQGNGFFRNQDTAEVYFDEVERTPAPPFPSPFPSPSPSKTTRTRLVTSAKPD